MDNKQILEALDDIVTFREEPTSEQIEALMEAMDIVEKYSKIGGWISCSEQLPDKWEDVMICYYNDKEEKYLSDIACLDDDGNWNLRRESGGYFPYNFKKKIVYWRPLPDLPEAYHG